MGRRRLGWYWSYIVRPATDEERTRYIANYTFFKGEEGVMFWMGRTIDPAKDGWTPYKAGAVKSFLTSDAETEAVLLTARQPNLLGKVRVVTLFEADPKPKRKKLWKAASGGTSPP